MADYTQEVRNRADQGDSLYRITGEFRLTPTQTMRFYAESYGLHEYKQ